MYVLLTDFRFVGGPTDERYVTGGGGGVRAGVTLCDRGVKIGQKKRYVIVERPLGYLKFLDSSQLWNSFAVSTGRQEMVETAGWVADNNNNNNELL